MDIRVLKPNEVTENYVKWFLDKNVTKYSENQYREFSFETQVAYVDNCLKNENMN